MAQYWNGYALKNTPVLNAICCNQNSLKTCISVAGCFVQSLYIVYENFFKDDNLGTMPANKMAGVSCDYDTTTPVTKIWERKGRRVNHAAHTWVFELTKEHSPRNGTSSVLKLQMGSINSFC